jgi:FKBP-type peptidyl-prolyl cis-trans isomerase 2
LVVVIASLVTGCKAAMPVDGDIVKVHYTGSLENGTVFDSSLDGDPLEFTIGTGQVISGFENGVKSLHVGETGTFTLPPEEAYGSLQDPVEITLEKDTMPEGLEPEIGLTLQMQLTTGQIAPATITEIGDTTITVSVDTNHSLAGKTLIFEIELVSIE